MSRFIQLFCLLVSIGLLWFFVFNICLVRYVPSESMEPTVMTGDVFVANGKVNDYQRGDIVVFSTKENSNDLVKRIIGLPGDVVSFSDGAVYINGELLVEDYTIGVSESETTEYTVPDDSYFLLGDNRENSNDSRFWEEPFATISDIKGKVIFSAGINNGIHAKTY